SRRGAAPATGDRRRHRDRSGRRGVRAVADSDPRARDADRGHHRCTGRHPHRHLPAMARRPRRAAPRSVARLHDRRRRPPHRPPAPPTRRRRMERQAGPSRIRPPGQPHRAAQAPAAQPQRRHGAALSARDHQAAHADSGNEQDRSRRVGYNASEQMTRPFLAGFLLAFLSTPLFAQAGKDMGPAAQYYGSPKSVGKKFKFAPGPKEGGCKEIEWGYAEGGHAEFVREEYAIIEKGAYVKCQDITIRADKMTYNFRTKDSVAEGHVIVDQGPMRLTGDRSVFNIDTKTGTLFNATGAMAPDMYFIGEKIEKTGDTTYRLTNGMLTSCELDNPSWSFHVAIADVTLDDYAHMQDVSFRAHRVPLFFTPRLVWPTKHDRSQGFLMPRLMFSSEFGTRLETSYFVPFGDAVDATAYADLSTTGYNGGGVNVRYRPSPNVKQGDFDVYTVRDKKADTQQWRYSYKHAQDNLPGGFRAVVDVEDFSNLDFFRRFSHDPRLHLLSQIYSSAYLTKNQPTYSLNILTDRRDVISVVSPDPTKAPARQRWEQLPSIQFRTYPNRLGNTPLYFSLESSVSHLLTTGLFNGPE